MRKENILRRNKSIRYLEVISIIIIGVAPIVSHQYSIPLYYLEPMRILVMLFVFRGYIKDAVILSFVYPLFSFLISGHPVIFKAPLVGLDLCINVLIFYFLIRKDMNKYLSFITAVICSKIIYYIFKYLIYSVLLHNVENVFETSIYIQLINIGILLFVIKLFYKKSINV